MKVLSGINREVSGLTGAGRGRILVTIAGGWLLLLGTQMIYPVLLPELREAYGLDLALAGLLVSTLWVSQAVAQVPAGLLTDRIGGRRILALSMGLAVVGVSLVVARGSVALLFGATALIGLSMACYSIARFTVINDLYPDRFGTSTGVIMAAADAGQTFFPPLAGIIAAWGSWTLGFSFVIPLFGFVGVLLWSVVPADIRRETDDRSTMRGQTSGLGVRSLVSALWARSVVLGTAVLVVYAIVWATFTTFYPTYLVEVKGLSSTTAAVLFGTFFALGIGIKPLAGAAYDRQGIRRSLLLVVTIPCAAFVLIPYAEGVWSLLGVTIMAAPLLGSSAAAQPYIFEVLPEAVEGTGFAIVRTVFLSIGGVSPVVFGAVADRGYFNEVYLLLAGLVAVNLVLALVIPENS